MKTSYTYLAIAFATLLCSCNEGITPDVIESQVQISANITPCVLTRVTEDGKSFTNGDAIKVQNMDRENKNLATYTYSESTGKWGTSDELYWNGEDANTFNAWYPTSAAYGSFTIPADQTSGIADSDWMTATASAKKGDGTVNLSFNHNLTKVTVTIESWGNEYSANEKIANALELNSLSSVISYDGTLSGDNTAKWVKAYVAQANTSFAAIIAPATYGSGDDIMQIYVNGSSTPLAVKTSSALTIESGKAYSFKLAVGKNLAEITSSVTVGEWDEVTLEDQQMTVETIKKIDYIDEYGINHGAGVEIDGVVWAPVNCGYHETDYPYGKLYQWGRKYGQGHGEEYNEPEPVIQQGGGYSDTETESNIFYARSSDMTYQTTSEAEYAMNGTQSSYALPIDWTNSSNDKLWNAASESSPQKTEHDPCPTGWRVPTHTELSNIKGLDPLPTIGTRNYDGRLIDGNVNYWSSTPSSRLIPWCSKTNSLNDIAYSDKRTEYRVYGYYVRCVHE